MNIPCVKSPILRQFWLWIPLFCPPDRLKREKRYRSPLIECKVIMRIRSDTDAWKEIENDVDYITSCDERDFGNLYCLLSLLLLSISMLLLLLLLMLLRFCCCLIQSSFLDDASLFTWSPNLYMGCFMTFLVYLKKLDLWLLWSMLLVAVLSLRFCCGYQ